MFRSFLSVFILAAALTTGALADDEPRAATQEWKEGLQYERIGDAPTRAKTLSPNAITVTEWFWLGCPHCDALEPHVLAWEHALPKDVLLKRVAVSWNQPERVAHAKLYYALEALGRTDLRQAAFDTIHRGNNPLYDPHSEAKTRELIGEFARSHQLDPERFVKTYSSAAADRYVAQSNEAAIKMHVPGVPAMSIDDKFTTDVARAGGAEPLLRLVDHLIEEETENLHAIDRSL